MGNGSQSLELCMCGVIHLYISQFDCLFANNLCFRATIDVCSRHGIEIDRMNTPSGDMNRSQRAKTPVQVEWPLTILNIILDASNLFYNQCGIRWSC